jgi:hypothetical protein
MTAVMIGVDPRKGSRTAVAIGAAEEPLGELRIGSRRPLCTPIIGRCEFAPNWRICARMTLNVLGWREANIRRSGASSTSGAVCPGPRFVFGSGCQLPGSIRRSGVSQSRPDSRP